MLVWVSETNAKTGETTRRQVDLPVVTEAAQQAVDASKAQAEMVISASTQSLDTQADSALANLRAYRDLASPTSAQTVAVVKLICRVLIGLIRFRLVKLDATD